MNVDTNQATPCDPNKMTLYATKDNRKTNSLAISCRQITTCPGKTTENNENNIRHSFIAFFFPFLLFWFAEIANNTISICNHFRISFTHFAKRLQSAFLLNEKKQETNRKLIQISIDEFPCTFAF